ncbi:hypothetical protein HNP40_001777 [Mycobacteroides chelonae]|nr:hypothetical protein [Mycobacteroides chelonae]
MTLTVSQARSWDPSFLDKLATGLDNKNTSYEGQLDKALREAEEEHSRGSGNEADARLAAAQKEHSMGMRIAKAIDAGVASLRSGGARLSGARNVAIGRVDDALQEKFEVSDTWKVTLSAAQANDKNAPARRDHHQSLVEDGRHKLVEADEAVSFDLDAKFDEVKAWAKDEAQGDDYEPPPLQGRSREEVAQIVKSAEFQEWMKEHPDAAKTILDAAFDAGQLDPNDPMYKNFLQGYWQREALEATGIDPSTWDPSKGAEANADTIRKVYEYYGKLFLEHPELQWAGMANMIGPSFAGAFFDLDQMQQVAKQMEANLPNIPGIPDEVEDRIHQLARMPASELQFYQTSLLSMQKEIFMDQAAMHEAYLNGGTAEIDRMRAAGLLDRDTQNAWKQIAEGTATSNRDLIAQGNAQLLHREQWDIIADDYDRMRNHSATGGVVTWGMTMLGAPSIPGAHSYAEIFPETFKFDPWGPGSIEVKTPFPDGNISHADQRWKLISQDTLPVYQSLLRDNPDLARQIIESNFNQRMDNQRIGNQIDDIVKRFIDGWKVEVHR